MDLVKWPFLKEIQMVNNILIYGEIIYIIVLLVPHHTMYGELFNRANFRLPVFDEFTRFGVWRIQKTQN